MSSVLKDLDQIMRDARRRDARKVANMRRFLSFVHRHGGWLCDDGFLVGASIVNAAEERGWVCVARRANGKPDAAFLTALGLAALTWGGAYVHTNA